jgi:hypothetical protein
MPAKINMFITNGNIFPPPLILPQNQVTKSKTVNSPLNSNMLSRIHNVRPGCGSCGRKG